MKTVQVIIMLRDLRKRRMPKLCLLSLILTIGVLYFHDDVFVDTDYLLESLLDYQKYDVKAERWIIIDVTNISIHMVSIHVEGWRVLVFGDWTKSKVKCSNCIHFGKDSLAKMKKYLPEKSNITNTKLQAVLYILYSGAEWIFWSNDIINFQEEVNQFKMAPIQTGLIYRRQGIMNPAHHFICQGEKTKNQTNVYQLWSWSVPSIQKVWQPERDKLSNTIIDYHAPPVLVPSLTFHTEALRGSLFHRNLVWSLASLFSTSKDPIWSFWIQRLSWEFDGTTEFLPPLRTSADILSKNVANRNGAKDQRDALAVLGRKLSSWKCNGKNTFYICVIELVNLMVEWNYFTQNEASMIKVWVSLLPTSQPYRKNIDGKSRYVEDLTNHEFAKNTKIINTKIISGHRVVFNPRGEISLNTSHQTKDKCSFMHNPFYSICNGTNAYTFKSFDVPVTINTSLPIDDILLIIIFNNPGFLDNVKYLNYMYGRHFSHIIVCGDSLDEFMKYDLTKHRVSFIEVNVKPGFHSYQCMMEVMKIGYDVQGYLQMGDDVLLNIWNIVDLPRNQVWFQTSMRAGNLSNQHVADIDTSTSTYWWGWKPELPNLKNVWTDFSLMSQDKNVAPKIKIFLNNLEVNSGNNNSAFYEASDIFYIPSQLKDDYVFFSTIFLKHKVFHEIAIPTVINGLVTQTQIVRMSGSYLWRKENRRKYIKRYNSRHTFLHPFKLNGFFKTKSDVKFICERYLPEIDKHLKKFFRNMGNNNQGRS